MNMINLEELKREVFELEKLYIALYEYPMFWEGLVALKDL